MPSFKKCRLNTPFCYLKCCRLNMKTSKTFDLVQPQQKSYDSKIESISKAVQESENKCENEMKEPRFKSRYMVVFLGFWIFFLLNCYRLNTSIGIVAMVNFTALSVQTKENSGSCPDLAPNATADEQSLNALGSGKQEGELLWSPELQGYILGSNFVGYVIAQIPSGRLVERFGCKWFIFWASFMTAISTLLIPPFSFWSAYAVIVLQTVRGVGQAFFLPAVSVLSSNWFPKTERGFLYTITMSGGPMGSCLGSLLTGLLCASAGKWPSSYYFFGALGTVVSVLIAVFIYESPKDHPKISEAELNYILSNQECNLSKRRPKIPWSKIFTSVPTYALIYAIFGQMWMLTQFLASHSIFLGTILNFPIKENGFVISITFLLQFLVAQGSAWLSSRILQKNLMSVDRIRKFCTNIAVLGYSLSILGVYLAGCDRNLSIVFAVLAMGFTGCGFAGCCAVPVDMTPFFSGTLNAISLTVGCMASVIQPLIVGYLTDEMQTIEQWNKVFFISIAVVMSSGLVFTIFGSADVQPWNFVEEESAKQDEESRKSDSKMQRF